MVQARLELGAKQAFLNAPFGWALNVIRLMVKITRASQHVLASHNVLIPVISSGFLVAGQAICTEAFFKIVTASIPFG